MKYKYPYTPNKKSGVSKTFIKKLKAELDKLRNVKKELKEKSNKKS